MSWISLNFLEMKQRKLQLQRIQKVPPPFPSPLAALACKMTSLSSGSRQHKLALLCLSKIVKIRIVKQPQWHYSGWWVFLLLLLWKSWEEHWRWCIAVLCLNCPPIFSYYLGKIFFFSRLIWNCAVLYCAWERKTLCSLGVFSELLKTIQPLLKWSNLYLNALVEQFHPEQMSQYRTSLSYRWALKW